MYVSPFDRMSKRVINRIGRPDVVYERDGAEYRPAAIFDNAASVAVLGDSGVEISSTDPKLTIHRDSLPFSPRRNDKVRVGDGKTVAAYLVKDAKPDSEGGIVLILHEDHDDEP